MFSQAWALSEQVVYPQAGEIYAKHHLYPVALLELVLSYHDEKLTATPSQDFMPQGRAIIQLSQAKDIDVLWTMTSTQREQEILPIRIPIYKGLIGWRLFLTNPTHLANNKSPSNINTLKQAIMIQGHDWPDTEILAFNGFNVLKVPNYEGFFKILSLNRAELFPRSLIEVWDELDSYGNRNIVLEPDTIISYPTATYFFVSPDNTRLASIIKTGLRKSLNDGKFDALFSKHYAERINKANLRERTHFRLSNPLLPKETPLNDKSLWFNLDHD
jgi:hypothetical protein